MAGSHAGRITVVTGAARGIGQALALGLAERGAHVVAVDVLPCDETVAAAVAAGGRCVSLTADIADESSVAALAGTVHARLGPVAILVNNAAVMGVAPFPELDGATFRRMVDVNLHGPFTMARAFAPDMIAAGWGRIVNVASSSVLTATPGIAAYMASKGGVLGLTSGLANDLGRHGITVNAVSPGLTRTPGVEADIAAGILPAEAPDAVIGLQAIPRAGTPQDIVGAVCFLTGEDAGFVTGQFLIVDGGMTRR